MSEKHPAVRFLTTSDDIKATVEYDGESETIEFESITLDEYREIEQLDDDPDMSDSEVFEFVFGEYLKVPDPEEDFDLGDIYLSKAMVMFGTMMVEWQQSESVQEALEGLNVEGNR